MTLFKQLKELEKSNPNKIVSALYFIHVLGLFGIVYIIFLSGIPEGMTIIEHYQMVVTPEYEYVYYPVFILLFLYIVAFIGLLKIETTSKYNTILIGYLWLITLPFILNFKFFYLIAPLFATYVYYKSRKANIQ